MDVTDKQDVWREAQVWRGPRSHQVCTEDGARVQDNRGGLELGGPGLLHPGQGREGGPTMDPFSAGKEQFSPKQSLLPGGRRGQAAHPSKESSGKQGSCGLLTTP